MQKRNGFFGSLPWYLLLTILIFGVLVYFYPLIRTQWMANASAAVPTTSAAPVPPPLVHAVDAERLDVVVTEMSPVPETHLVVVRLKLVDPKQEKKFFKLAPGFGAVISASDADRVKVGSRVETKMVTWFNNTMVGGEYLRVVKIE